MLDSALHHKNPFVRKASMFALGAVKRSLAAPRREELLASPPILTNSFPKSGTHLLEQIVSAMPARVNYGEFLSSMTSSFRFRRRPTDEINRRLRTSRPGELVRAHLFYDETTAEALRDVNAVHYFIYRDPRDVIVSSCHYLREMNRWHKLHKLFAACGSMEEAILLSIRGRRPIDPQAPLPSIAERFADYEGWVTCDDALALKFEDLTGHARDERIRTMIDRYAEQSIDAVDKQVVFEKVVAAIDPKKSHTFRSGKRGGWQEDFTPACRDAFKEVAGDLLIRMGYEADNSW